MQNKPVRSDEPIFWLLFGAGGMAVAMALPAILIILLAAGVSGPDLTSGLLNFEQAKAIFGNWFANLVLFTILGGVFFHSFHRLYHSLHDVGITPLSYTTTYSTVLLVPALSVLWLYN